MGEREREGEDNCEKQEDIARRCCTESWDGWNLAGLGSEMSMSACVSMPLCAHLCVSLYVRVCKRMCTYACVSTRVHLPVVILCFYFYFYFYFYFHLSVYLSIYRCPCHSYASTVSIRAYAKPLCALSHFESRCIQCCVLSPGSEQGGTWQRRRREGEGLC